MNILQKALLRRRFFFVCFFYELNKMTYPGQSLSPAAHLPAQRAHEQCGHGGKNAWIQQHGLKLTNTELYQVLNLSAAAINVSFPTALITERWTSRGEWIILDFFHHKEGTRMDSYSGFECPHFICHVYVSHILL